jgi:hypothetical protein
MSNVSVTTRTLDILNVCVSRLIPTRLLEKGIGGRWDVQARMAYETDAAVLQVVGYLAADHIETVIIAYPRDWVQAVKERWAPLWAIKRWPVVKQRHEIRLDAAYPKMPLPEREFGKFIRIQRATVSHTSERVNEQ